jgi:hypothetical protein
MDTTAERKREIDDAVADIRTIEAREGASRSSLERIKQRLMRLAARQELFRRPTFPRQSPAGDEVLPLPRF